MLHIDVTVDDGKYRFTQDEKGHARTYRHGELWIDGSFAGINMVIAMACEIEELRKATGKLNDRALSRNTDPGTSRLAAKKADLRLNESRRTVLGYAIQRDPSGGFIDDDLRRTYANGETLRKRRSDLTDAGYIAPVEGQTRLNRSGNFEQVWRVTDKGRNAL